MRLVSYNGYGQVYRLQEMALIKKREIKLSKSMIGVREAGSNAWVDVLQHVLHS